jgi:signal transduction histidine kinase
MRKLTIRVRLTVLYGGMFLLAGMVLLGVTYLLMKQSLDSQHATSGVALRLPTGATGGGAAAPLVELADGPPVSLDEAANIINQRQVEFQNETLNSLLTQGGIALLAVGLVALAFGWLMAERALRPVHEITATARRVAAAASAHRGLGERIALAGPHDEIKELADTFDDMLERLNRSFDGQRRFVANASHELRTPLAINRALIDVAVTRPDASPDLQRLGEALVAVNSRHERLMDGLLTLAESENDVTDATPVDLRDVAVHVLDQTPSNGASVRRELAPTPTAGDPILLERLVQNLVDNAVRHNQPDGWFEVCTGVRDQQATVTVTNTGPVVAPYDVEAIFEPFRRLGGDRVRSERGFGLGLSIVRAVARAHGGEVRADPRPGGGLVVTARLPLRVQRPPS